MRKKVTALSPPQKIQSYTYIMYLGKKIEREMMIIFGVPRLTGKTRITGKTTEIPERPKNNRRLFPVLILLALFV